MLPILTLWPSLSTALLPACRGKVTGGARGTERDTRVVTRGFTVAGLILHVFVYIPLTRVQLFLDKPRPFAEIDIDASAHA